MQGCGKRIKDDYWQFCGETDMGQTAPVLCVECGGEYELLQENTEDTEYEPIED